MAASHREPMTPEQFVEYRRQMLADGDAFEDYVYERLMIECGLFAIPYKSKTFQIHCGENSGGIEIKHDMKMFVTGNVYIETAEKGTMRGGDYVPAGIYKREQPWMFAIGDYGQWFLLPVKYLQSIDGGHSSINVKRKEQPTSKGFVLSVDDARRVCVYECRDPVLARDTADTRTA